MAQLIHGTTIANHLAIHAGNLADHNIATTSYVTTQIDNLIDGAPGALDTLNELAAALGDNANFATGVTDSIAGKVSKAGDIITTSNAYGLVIDHTPVLGDFVDALLLRSTTSGQRAQLGFATVDADGNHHRASIRAYKGAGTLEGVFGIALRQVGGNHTQRLTLTADGNLTIDGQLIASGGNSSQWNTAFGWGNHAGLYAAASHNHDDRYYTETESDARYLYYRGYSTSGDFQTLQSSERTIRFDQVGATENWSNAPGGYTYGGVLSLRGDNFGFQLWGSHTGDFFYKTQWNNDQHSGWRQVITSMNIGSQSVAYANQVGINYNNNSDATYQLLWGSGNSVYGTAEVYVNPSTDHIYASGFVAGSDIYLGVRGVWLSSWLNQSVQTGASPTFNNVFANGIVGNNASQTRDKLRVWDSGEYTIGMKNGYSFGHIGSGEYAMSFQMNNNNSRGFWWGDTAHSDAQGAAALTTDGRMNIARSLSIGEGESATEPNSTPLYVKGSTDGADVFAVDGINGRLFTVTDSLIDSIYSVNTIAGLPVFEVFANSTVVIGKYGLSTTFSNDGSITTPGSVTTGGTITTPSHGNSSQWNTAYNKRPTAISFSGGSTKTLTLTHGDGSTLTAAFNDIDTDTNTDGQTLSISGSTLTISGGNSISLPSGGISQATADGLYQPLENQRLSTGDGPTFANVYTNGWFRNNNVNEGLYNQATATHLYSSNGSGWTITGSGGIVELVFRSNHQNTIRGYVYADTSNNIGFLTNDGNWGLQVDSSKNAKVFGYLTVGNGTSSDIYMTDTDETTRRIHCNSGRIGFLNSASAWGAWNDNTGNWSTDFNMYASSGYFYGSGSIRLGDMWGGAGLYRPSGNMVFGIENSDWIFSKGAVTQAYFAGGDGNLWMRWAGDWLSNLLGAKSNTGHTHDDRYYTESESDSRYLAIGGKAADSELLDGINSSSFVRNDTTGQYLRAYYQYTSYLTTERPIDLRNQMGGSGMRVDFMNSGGGGNWNHVITFSGYDAYNMYQLGGYYDGGSTTNLYVRSEANHGTTSWTAWRRLLNEVADPYAVNMNQYVRTTDNVSFNALSLPNDSLIIINGEPDTWGVRFRTNASTTNLGGQLKNIIYCGGGVAEGFAVTGQGTGSTAFEVTNAGNAFIKDSLYVNGANSRIQAGSTSIDGMLYDSSGRPALVARAAYPHIELWADVSNSNHGGTLRFGGYDNGSSGAYKNWNIGTPGSNLYFLDIAYGGTSNPNPHAGIAGLGEANSYPGAFNMMRFHNNGNIGVGNFGEYGSEGNNPAYKFDVRGNGRYTGLLYLDAAESLNLYGIRGRFTNEYIHLYSKVGIGHPSGWGQGEGNTPSQGLSTYGGANIGYGTGAGLSVTGLLRIASSDNLYLDTNYGQSIVGVYSAERYQGIFAMGDSYKLAINGTTTGNLYGLAWSHPNAGGVAGNLNTHGLLVMENGTFLAAVSGSIRARDDVRAPALYDSGSRVAISRGEGRDYVEYSRYVYNNGAYSGSGWIEPSDLGVRYANSAGSAPNAGNLNASYGVTAGAGNGLKFWNGSDTYKISMGNSDEYHYGPVTDYSIKTVIDSVGATRGFTWGVNGGTPIAALNVGNGNMQIAGTFTASNFSGTSSGTNTGDQTNISGNAATATTAGALTSMNISQFTNNSGYITQSSAAPRAYVTDSFVDFVVDGDADKYYPVVIQPWNGGYGFQRYSIHRGYSWTAPWDPIGTGSHKGGLTLTFDWSGDIAWGGNDKTIRVIQFGESYTTMVSGLQLDHCAGVVVWLRGGSAQYRLHGPGGVNQGYSINLSGFTGCAGVNYPVRSYDSGTVTSEIYSRYPVRSTTDLFYNNNAVIHAGNIGSQSVNYASSSGSTGNADTVDGYHATFSGNANTIPVRNASGYLEPNNWIQLNGIYGLYAPTNNAHLRPNDASYGSWLVTGSRNGWRGIEFDSGSAGNVTVMISADSNTVGFHNNSYGWQIRWANGTMYIAKNSYGGNEATVIDSSSIGSQSVASAGRATRANGNFYIDDNYGNTVVGVYESTRLQGVWAMGDAYKLSADGTSAANHYGIAWSHPNHGGEAVNLTDHGVLIQTAGRTRTAISSTIWCIGDIIAFSDARVKANVEVIDNPLERLSKVRGVTFTRTDLEDPTKRYTGVIAQEMREALPEAVSENAHGELSVSYGNTVSLLIESIKAQQAQIEELKLEVKKLKGE